MKDELKEVADFYEFKKNRNSSTTLEDCVLICQNNDTKLFLSMFCELLNEYRDKEEFFKDLARLADMEEDHESKRRN